MIIIDGWMIIETNWFCRGCNSHSEDRLAIGDINNKWPPRDSQNKDGTNKKDRQRCCEYAWQQMQVEDYDGHNIRLIEWIMELQRVEEALLHCEFTMSNTEYAQDSTNNTTVANWQSHLVKLAHMQHNLLTTHTKSITLSSSIIYSRIQLVEFDQRREAMINVNAKLLDQIVTVQLSTHSQPSYKKCFEALTKQANKYCLNKVIQKFVQQTKQFEILQLVNGVTSRFTKYIPEIIARCTVDQVKFLPSIQGTFNIEGITTQLLQYLKQFHSGAVFKQLGYHVVSFGHEIGGKPHQNLWVEKRIETLKREFKNNMEAIEGIQIAMSRATDNLMDLKVDLQLFAEQIYLLKEQIAVENKHLQLQIQSQAQHLSRNYAVQKQIPPQIQTQTYFKLELNKRNARLVETNVKCQSEIAVLQEKISMEKSIMRELRNGLLEKEKKRQFKDRSLVGANKRQCKYGSNKQNEEHIPDQSQERVCSRFGS